MIGKKTQEFGAVSQEYYLKLSYEKTIVKDGVKTKAEVEKNVSLTLAPYWSGPFEMCRLVEFQKGANALLKEIWALLKAGTRIEVELVVAAYERVPEYKELTLFGPHMSTIKQISYDRWFYSGDGWNGDSALDLSAGKDGGGLYIKADIKYTEECHDMFFPWGDDILKCLAEAGA